MLPDSASKTCAIDTSRLLFPGGAKDIDAFTRARGRNLSGPMRLPLPARSGSRVPPFQCAA